VGAVLLAAGESRRMGGIDKRRLELDGEPLVRRWLRILREAGIGDVVVVLGHRPELVLPLVEGQGATVVINPDHRRGQQSSVLAGLAALPAGIDAAMVALVDLALVDAQDLRALVDAFADRPAGKTALVPFFGGQRGNPVIVSAGVAARVLAAGEGGSSAQAVPDPRGESSSSGGPSGGTSSGGASSGGASSGEASSGEASSGEASSGEASSGGASAGEDPAAGLRGYLQAHPHEVCRHEAGSDHFTFDLDTREDIARLERRLGRPIGRPQAED
jgi:molybdenum cofactor cytidylyltransferase